MPVEAAFRIALFSAHWAEFTTMADAVVIVDPDSEDLLSSLEQELYRAYQVVNRIRSVGHAYEDDYDLEAISDLLCDAFTDSDLRRFCRNRRELCYVVRRFGSHFSLEDLADVVIDYCRTRAMMPNLLAEIERVRPGQFARYRDRLYGSSSSLLDGRGIPLTRKSEAPEWDSVLASLEEFQQRGAAIRVHEALRRRLERLVAELASIVADRLSTHAHLAVVEEQLRELAQQLLA
jgi:hypothetical protein